MQNHSSGVAADHVNSTTAPPLATGGSGILSRSAPSLPANSSSSAPASAANMSSSHGPFSAVVSTTASPRSNALSGSMPAVTSTAPPTPGGGGGSGSLIAVPVAGASAGATPQLSGAAAAASSASKRGSFTLPDSATQSPSQYREKVKNLQESCDHLWVYLRKIADTSRSLAVTGSVADAVQFADELLEFAFARNDQKEGGLLSQNLKNIGSALKDIETMRSTLLEQLENIVTIPLEQFLQVDIKGALEMKKRLVKTRDQYEAAQLKYDLIRTAKKKKDQAEKAEKLETELGELKKLYELTNINYTNRLAKIDAKKSFEILERLGTFMYATMTFFHHGYDMLSELEPSLRELMGNLDEERKLYLMENLKQEGPKKATSTKTLEKQGYLFVRIRGRSGGMRWKRRWFVVAEGGFHTYRSWKELNPSSTHDMLLSTVKAVSDTEPPHKNFVFSLVGPNKETMLLQAASEKDRSEWMEVLHNSIGYRLKQSQLTNSPHHAGSLSAVQRPYEQLRNLSEANWYCADCNQPDPEWAAVNLGALLCEKCAGVHRGLGVHISRVKSLVLDKWEPELLMLMKTIGNAMANSIWEFNVSAALKPHESCDRDTRERYIKAKYELRRFTQRLEINTVKLQEQLLEAVLESDVVRVYHLLAQGASPDYQDANKKTVLHHACDGGATNLFCLELLINLVDDKGRSALHYAALHDRASAGRLLMNRGANPKLKDADGKTPEDLANEFNCRNYQSLLSTDEFEERRKRSRFDRSPGGGSAIHGHHPPARGLFPSASVDALPTKAALERMRTEHSRSISSLSTAADGSISAPVGSIEAASLYNSPDGPSPPGSTPPQASSSSKVGSGGGSTKGTTNTNVLSMLGMSAPTPTVASMSTLSSSPLSPASQGAPSPRLRSASSATAQPDPTKLASLKQAMAVEVGQINEGLEKMKVAIKQQGGKPPTSLVTSSGEMENGEDPSELIANKLRVVKMLLFHEPHLKEKKEVNEDSDSDTDSEDSSEDTTEEDVDAEGQDDDGDGGPYGDNSEDDYDEGDEGDDDDGDDGGDGADDEDDANTEEDDHGGNHGTKHNYEDKRDYKQQDDKGEEDKRDEAKDQQRFSKKGSWLTSKFPSRDETGERPSGTYDDSVVSSRLMLDIDGKRGFRLSPRDLVLAAASNVAAEFKRGSMSERESKSRQAEPKDDSEREEKDHDKNKLRSSQPEKEEDKDGKTLGDKVKDWARRKGSAKRRGSEDAVLVNHNPIHNIIKINANAKEKENRERELADTVKPS